MDYRRYRVKPAERGPLLEFMLGALQGSGCTILNHSPPTEAPFRIVFDTPSGERIGLLAYAFFANTRLTKNRPEDEWRFQVKYGPRPDEPQPVWIDPLGVYTTIFLGINPARGIFVAADPRVHNPTRFFISVEFKEAQVAAVAATGWHAWERERRGRDDSEPIEVLVGGSGDQFLQYVKYERAAAGLDAGHRQLLAERWLERPQIAAREEALAQPPVGLHHLAREFEMTEAQVLDMVATQRRLKMAVRGWVAERHLVSRLVTLPDVTECVQLDLEGGADVSLCFRGSAPLTIQCKNVLRKRAADGSPRVDFQKTRPSKGDPCSRYYRRDDFDVIAACLHAVTERWEFSYVLPGRLEGHKTCVGRLNNNVRVDGRWTMNAAEVLAAAADLNK